MDILTRNEGSIEKQQNSFKGLLALVIRGERSITFPLCDTHLSINEIVHVSSTENENVEIKILACIIRFRTIPSKMRVPSQLFSRLLDQYLSITIFVFGSSASFYYFILTFSESVLFGLSSTDVKHFCENLLT
jgi:hypothetical protein